MLNRRILRIKAFKAIYAYAENPSMSLKDVEAQLEISCQSTRTLYLFMLSVVKPLVEEARGRIEAAKSKFNPTEEEKNPNMKFVNNSIYRILTQDPDFTKIISKSKLSWDQFDVFLRKLYDSIRSKEYFAEYMASPESSLQQDAELFVKIFEEEFMDSADLDGILEDMSLYWIDDLGYALTYCCRTMEDLAAGRAWSLPPLYQSEMAPKAGQESDKAFVSGVVRTAYVNFDKFSQYIAEAVPKWDGERLVTIDKVLVLCGLAEAKCFSEIPVKVTINEYVDISKFYSTPKSRSFVNGLLDTIIKKKIEEGEIVKTGKGLV